MPDTPVMHLLLSTHGNDAALADEIRYDWPATATHLAAPGLVAVDGVDLGLGPPRPLAFARQLLPDAQQITAASVSAWAAIIFDAAAGVLPINQPWRLHVAPRYSDQAQLPSENALPRPVQRRRYPRPATTPSGERASRRRSLPGQRRCQLIYDALKAQLKERRRHLLRQLQTEPEPFTPADSLVQVLLASPTAGWCSVAEAPWPYTLRQMVWPFPQGEVPVAADKRAPSRAFAKLVEAETRLGRRIAPGETCVDLGAAPGSWTYVALQRGAQVAAVDRSPLRDDLMQHPGLRFVRGDAFAFACEAPVDWLLCDVIAAPERSVTLLLDWLRRKWARRFVVTIKFKGRPDFNQLSRLKAELPSLAAEWRLVQLSANKNEVCAFGSTLP